MSFSVGISHGYCDADSCPCKNVSLTMTIWTACEQGYKDHVVAKLLRDSKAVNKLDSYGYTPLHYAAQQNHLEIVSFLLRKGALADLEGCGATPLHRAAFSGHLEACKLLLSAGANINAQDRSYGDLNTPCHKAALAGHTEVVNYLLQHSNIDSSIVNSSNQTVFDVLSSTAHQVQAEPLKESSAVEPVECLTQYVGMICNKCLNPSLSLTRGANNTLLCFQCRYSN